MGENGQLELGVAQRIQIKILGSQAMMQTAGIKLAGGKPGDSAKLHACHVEKIAAGEDGFEGADLPVGPGADKQKVAPFQHLVVGLGAIADDLQSRFFFHDILFLERCVNDENGKGRLQHRSAVRLPLQLILSLSANRRPMRPAFLSGFTVARQLQAHASCTRFGFGCQPHQQNQVCFPCFHYIQSGAKSQRPA